jgi:hypothetical protein
VALPDDERTQEALAKIYDRGFPFLLSDSEAKAETV